MAEFSTFWFTEEAADRVVTGVWPSPRCEVDGSRDITVYLVNGEYITQRVRPNLPCWPSWNRADLLNMWFRGYVPDGLVQIATSAPEPDGYHIRIELARAFPALDMPGPRCPNDGVTCFFWNPDRSLGRTIIHLNDDHGWPREQIADWLESLDVDLTFHEATDLREEVKP